MNQTSRSNVKKVDKLPVEMSELESAIAMLPAEHRDAVGPIFDRVAESAKRRRRILTLVQDALGQLRLDMKYLIFDLEATRRERDDFHQRLEEGDE